MMLRPQQAFDQQIISADLTISPEPSLLRHIQDAAGACVGVARFEGLSDTLTFESKVRLNHIVADPLDLEDASALVGQDPIIVEGDFTQAAGHRAATQLMALDQRPDAVFAANDMMALGALLAFQEAGVRCPEDVAVVGFDDVPLAALVRPTLTTLRVNIAEMGRRGVERLIGLVQAGANAEADTACEIVRPALVVRQSTAAAATAGSNPDQTAASLS